VPVVSEVHYQRSIGGDASRCSPIHRPGLGARKGDGGRRAAVAKDVLEAGLESAGEKGEDRVRLDFQPGLPAEDGWDSVAVQGSQAEIHCGVVESRLLQLIHCLRLAAVAATGYAVRH